jgi:tetratricopeptide (TPR) repeat protein
VRRLVLRCAPAIAGIAVLAVGCRAQSSSAPASETQTATGVPSDSAADGRAIRQVELPDISGAAGPVQAQLRERFASLQQQIGTPGTPPASLAAAYGDMGRLFMATEFLDQAGRCFRNAQRLDPGEMQWPYYLGHVQRLQNEPAKAAALFEQALTLQPEHVPSLVWLGEMHLIEGRPEAAGPPLQKALSLQPREAAALFRLGRANLAAGDYAGAVKNLEAALALRPQASSIHYPLALAYRGLGDARNAEAQMRLRGNVDVPPVDPLMQQVAGLLQNAAASEVRGAEALGKRQWPEAVTYLRKAVESAPDNAFTRLNLGTALFQTGDAGGALEQFQAAVRLSPGLAKAQFGIGIVTEAAGRDRDAIDAFSAAVKADPSYVEARLSLADALRRNARMEESLPHYAEVIRVSPAVSQARFGYAMALVRLKRYREARDRLADDVKTYPDQPGFAHALARLLAAAPDDRVRDGRGAMALMQELTKTQRTLELAQTMAMTLAELGQYEEAVSWQRDAIAAAKQTGREDLTDRLEDNLKRYENRQSCRVPWRDDDAVFHPRPAR